MRGCQIKKRSIAQLQASLINRVSIIISLSFFILVIFVGLLKAEIKNDEEFNNFTTYYYLNPRPSEVLQALEYYFKSSLFRDKINTDGHSVELMSYFFGRVANINPNLIREYEKFYDSKDLNEKLFLISIFAFASDEQNKEFFKEKFAVERDEDMRKLLMKISDNIPKANRRVIGEIGNYNDLDFYWIEFFVTGEKDPIVKLINVLSWKDRFKEKLNAWFITKHSDTEKVYFKNLLKNELHVDINNYEADFDIDCLYSNYLMPSKEQIKPTHGAEIRRILNLSEDDILYMATKGAAMWSLQSNARQHPKVLEYCKQEFKNRHDKAKMELAIIIEITSPGSLEYLPTKEKNIVGLKLRETSN